MKKCDYCNQTFRFEVGLKSHIKTVHSNKKPEPNCDNCDQKFKTRQDLQTHMKIVHNGWQCKECEKTFGNSYLLKEHYGFEHEGLTKPKCNQCGKTFLNNNSLRNHINNVHGKDLNEKLCDDCGEILKIKDLPIHMINVHKGWKCDQCDERLTSLWYLRVHRQNHKKATLEKI